MADSSPKLTEEQKQKAVALLTAKGATRPCPICQHPNWFMADSLIIDNGFFPDGSVIIGGAAYPALVIFCSNCAFMRMHSAVALGIVPAEKKDEKEAKHGTS